jgi:nucleoside phosphorylase
MRDDENEAVLDRLSPAGFYAGKHRTYAVATVHHRTKGDYPIAVMRTSEQGPNKAQDIARDAIEDLDPEYIVLSGIAGGVPSKEFTLGDVLVATRLHDFSVGALMPNSPPQVTNQGGPMTKRVQDLVTLLPALRPQLAGWQSAESIRIPRPPVKITPEALYGDADWQKNVRESLEYQFGEQRKTEPIATGRAIASSGNLIKNAEIVAIWQKAARDLMGMEMELSGVYEAANRAHKMYSVIAVRGLSDIVGFRRDDAWTKYAAHTAGAFCVALLKNMPENFLPWLP